MDIKEKAKIIKRKIPALFLAMKRSDTPLSAKIMAGLTVGYALSPIDLIPDFIPVLGYLDDIILLPVMIAFTIKLIPDQIMNECMEDSENMWSNGKPKKWYYAIPIILVYALIIYIILKPFLNK